jgi:hypothetical protein
LSTIAAARQNEMNDNITEVAMITCARPLVLVLAISADMIGRLQILALTCRFWWQIDNFLRQFVCGITRRQKGMHQLSDDSAKVIRIL